MTNLGYKQGDQPGVNLAEFCGDRYKVVDDGTDDPCREERPWCMEIQGRYGAIYPYGSTHFHPDLLAVRVDSPRIWMRDFDHLGLKVRQWGDDEKVFLFPVSMLDEIAGLIKARRRRQVSPEQKAELLRRLKVVA